MTSIASARSNRSRVTVAHSLPGSTYQPPRWWQRRPILKTAFLTDLQKGSYFAAIFTLVEAIFQILIAVFDLYCLIEARPGSRHFRSFGFSFVFVYAGNEIIRYLLIASALILLLAASYLLVSSLILMAALKKEHEIKFKHWIYSSALFIICRTVTIFFQSIVNDMYFGYHQAMLIIWLLLLAADVFAFLIVVSNYQELSNITKLEDMAKLKMSTLSSLNTRSLSHHSLDSYKGAYGTVNMGPSGGSRAGSTTASLASFNMGYGSVGQIVTNRVTSSHPPSTTSSVPLSHFGLNFNPNGVFTIEQLTGSTNSLNARGQTPIQSVI